MSDELTLEERLTLPRIRELADKNTGLARRVVQLAWIQEEIDDDKLLALSSIGDIADVSDAIAGRAIDKTWVADGVSERERFVLDAVRDIASDDPEVALQMLDSPSVADGLSPQELERFTGSRGYLLERIRAEYPRLWETIRGYDWVSQAISRTAPASPSGILASPLPVGDLTSQQRWVLIFVRRIASVDPVLGERVATLPWLADEISDAEMRMLDSLARIADENPGLMRQLLDLPWLLDDITEYEWRSVRVCWLLNGNDTGQTQLLMDQAWFRDDITGEDFALIVTLRTGCWWNPYFRELVEKGQILSQTLGGSKGAVNLYAVSRAPLGSRSAIVFQGLRTGIEAIEEFLGSPWFKTDVIVYLEPEYSYIRDVAGLNYGTHIMVKLDPSSPHFNDVLYHELAHFYFGYGNVPVWLAEGGANFLESYTVFRSETASMQSRFDLAQRGVSARCVPQGIARVNELLEGIAHMPYRSYLRSTLWLCTYPLGESFLLGLYVGMGHEVVASSMRVLYERGSTTYVPASEVEIYQVFLSNTPAARQDEFKKLYHCLHGRPIAGFVPQGTNELGIPCPVDHPAQQLPTPSPTPARTSAPLQVEGTVAGDRAALIAFYNATWGPGWVNDDNWLTDEPLDKWFGVSTDTNGRVFKLDIRENNAKGRLVGELGQLGALRELLIGNRGFDCDRETCTPNSDTPNQFTGAIPEELSNLNSLLSLDLTVTGISGTIPPWLGRLPKLRSLNLSGNRFVGGLPAELGERRKLVVLGVSHNLLNIGTVPYWVASLRDLHALNLGRSGLTGTIPSYLGDLSRLRSLDLAGNQLTGEIPSSLGNLSDMEWLNLSSNQLSGQIPSSLGNLKELRGLLLLGNQLSGCIPKSLEYVNYNDMVGPLCQ